MSQLPEMPAAGWPDQGYEPSAYPQQDEALSAQGAAQQYAQVQTGPEWQQDTQPDWGGQQQGYAQPEYQQQEYPAQGYQQQGQGYPAQQQQQWAGQAEPTMSVPPQGAAESVEGLPTEFDHLFRDSTPDSRRAIDRQKPAVGGAAAGYLNGVQSEAAPPAQAAPPEQTAVAPQSAPYAPFQAFPQQQAEQYPSEQYQGSPSPFQSGQYAPAEYPQPGPGYGGEYDNGADYSGNGFDGGSGNGTHGGARNRRPWIIGGAVALVAVIGIVIANSGGSPGSPAAASNSPSAAASKATPKQRADQIYQLIQQSGQLRSDASGAVTDVNGCTKLTDAQSVLTTTAQKRQSQADSVAKLDVTGITNGAQLVSKLQQAWTASAQYDNAYAQVAADMQAGCKTSSVKKDSNYKAASQAAGTADTAKSAAAQLWNDNVASASSLNEPQVTGSKL